MLVLKRLEGQWTEILDPITGKKVEVRVCNTRYGQVDLVFRDENKDFVINRPERSLKKNAPPLRSRVLTRQPRQLEQV